MNWWQLLLTTYLAIGGLFFIGVIQMIIFDSKTETNAYFNNVKLTGWKRKLMIGIALLTVPFFWPVYLMRNV